MDSALTAPQTKEVEALFALGAHLGHKKNRLHPKSRKYVYKMVNGVSVIDLTQTVKKLDEVKKFMKSMAKEEKKLLVVATKKIANQKAAELCTTYNIPFVTNKWLPGLLTNFDTIIKNVKKMNQLKEDQQNGKWDEYVKHERIALGKQLSKLQRLYGGLSHLTARPQALLVVDIKKEKNAVKEAHQNNIPVIAIVDTNSNPDTVMYPIVVNDDATGVVDHVLAEVLKAYGS